MKRERKAKRCGKVITEIRNIRLIERYYKGRLCYAIERKDNGYTAVFNHKKEILQDIIERLNADYNICLSASNKNLIVFKKGKCYMSLAKFSYCSYHNINCDTVCFNNNIVHKSKREYINIEDCRKENLCMGGTSVFFDDEENRVVIKSNNDNIYDVFEPKQVLVDIFQNEDVIIYRGRDNRLKCNMKNHSGFNVADLAYLAYYDTELTTENYIEKLQKFRAYKKDNGYNIEHLDGDFTNHYKYNIALVEEGLNSKKSDKITQIMEPYFFTVVTDGNNFKILIGNFEENLIVAVERRYITNKFENVVKLLLAYLEEYPQRINKAKAKEENEKLIQKRFFAEMLAKEPDEHFTPIDTLLASTEDE